VGLRVRLCVLEKNKISDPAQIGNLDHRAHSLVTLQTTLLWVHSYLGAKPFSADQLEC